MRRQEAKTMTDAVSKLERYKELEIGLDQWDLNQLKQAAKRAGLPTKGGRAVLTARIIGYTIGRER